MIYMVYISKSTGELIWSFKHPKAPKDVLGSIAGKEDSLISGFISAITNFGYETIGDRIQSMDFMKIKMLYRYVMIGEENLLIVAITDREDIPATVWRIINSFISQSQGIIKKMIEPLLLQPGELDEIYNKLETNFLNYLNRYVRKIPQIAYRNNQTIIIGMLSGIISFFLMFLVTLWINDVYGLYSSGRFETLLYVIFFNNFLIPSLVIGWVTGFARGALIASAFTSVVVIVSLSINFSDVIFSFAGAWNIGMAVVFGVLVVAFIIGAAMGIISSTFARMFVESRTLIPPPLE
ncbi:MAG: hypothetical protein ACTSVW_03915 [Candidatus Njordarchaeales archaeon]